MLQLKIEINEEKELDTYLYFFFKNEKHVFCKTTGQTFSVVSITYTCQTRLVNLDILQKFQTFSARQFIGQPTHVLSKIVDWLLSKKKGGACFRKNNHWPSLGPLGVLGKPILSIYSDK